MKSELNTHLRLLTLLDTNNARYKIINHLPEGRSKEISRLRGNNPAQAMKAIVLSVKGGGKDKRNVMAVIPGNRRLNMKALLYYLGAQKGKFSKMEEVARLTGCVQGAIPPFSFNKELALVIDHSFRNWDEVAFNAGRLDKSIMLNFDDYLRIVKPNFFDLINN